jgi:hypothetical protein
MAAASSAIGEFRRELDVCRGLHNEFPPKSSTFKDHIARIEEEIVAVRPNYPIDTIETTVQKIKDCTNLTQKLKDDVSPEIQRVLQSIKENNSKLEQLKLEIETAIEQAKIAAAAKAEDEAKTEAAEKEALNNARYAIDIEIANLTQFKTNRQQQFEKTLYEKNLEVTGLNQKITGKNDEITSKIAGKDYISDETRAIVKDITDDISSIVANDFGRISADINTRGLEPLAKFDAIIENLQLVRNGTDIAAMTDAVSGINGAIVSPSLELDTILKEPDTFIKKLQAKSDEVLSKAEPVTVAIQRDRVIAEMIQEANTLNNPEAQKFKDKLKKAAEVNDTETKKANNILLGSLLEHAKGPLSRFEQPVLAFTDKFKELNEEWSKSGIAESMKQSELKNTIDVLNRLYQDEKAKYNSLHDKFEANNLKLSASQERPSSANSMSSTSSVSPTGSVSPSSIPSPIQDNPLALIPAPPLSLKRSGYQRSDTRGAAGPVKDAWNTSSLRSLSPPPRLQQSTESPDRQSTALVGPRQHLIFIPRNQKGTPSEAYLVELPADDGSLSPRSIGESSDRGGGKRKHLQRGGAPPPERLPSNSEIRIVNAYNPGMADLITGLTPPNVLLKDSSDPKSDHQTIAKIRTGIPIVDQTEKTRIYGQIRRFLITKESRNPLDIGRKAVYKVNVLDLLRLLDKQLGIGGQYRVMYQELWTFMEYKFGTFSVLESLFKTTINRPSSPRLSSTPQPTIAPVFNPHDIKKIVGWNSKPQIHNELFNELFDMFSIKCKNGIKSTFLSNDNPTSQTNLGSKPKFYYRFRLNWIILLAFHSLYIGSSKPENVGILIHNMHDAFLGWMSRDKDTFKRTFFPEDRNSVTSRDTYSTKVKTIINDTIQNAPSLSNTVATIRNKICELQDNTDEVTVIDPDVGEDEDPDYVPSSDDDDDALSDDALSDDGRTSSRGSLSSAGLSYKDVVTGGPTTRNGRQPLRQGLAVSAGVKDILSSSPPIVPRLNLPRPNALLDLGKKERLTPEFINAARSTVGIIQLPVPKVDDDPSILFRAGDRTPTVTNQFLDSSRAAADAAAAPVTSRTFQHSTRSTTPANQELWATKVLPRPPGQNGEFIRQEKNSSRPSSASSFENNTSTNSQGSVQGSVQESASGWLTGRRGNRVHPSPIVGATNPEWVKANREWEKANSERSGLFPIAVKTKKNSVVPTDKIREFGVEGGSHKKRTRKHKKHISRHPTRRRRITKPTPPEGHKYTRKRSRT